MIRPSERSRLIDILEYPLQWERYITEPGLRTLLAAALVVVLLSVFSRVLTAVMLRLGRGFLFTKAVSEQLEKPIRVLLPLLGLQAVLAAASEELAFIDAARRITTLLIIGCITWVALRLLRGVEHAVRLKNPVDVTDNLRARQIQTQSRVLLRTLSFFILLVGAAGMLMTFPAARQFGASLLASAGLAGLAVGFAARPVLANLIAGIQIAVTQPIRLDDVVIVENEWGRIEEITGTYVVVRIWDDRRLVVPLQYFIEKPFQNWTRSNSSIIG